jgi:hypothetical protein
LTLDGTASTIRRVIHHDDFLSEEEAQALFAPYLRAVSDCWLSGWDAWEVVKRTRPGSSLSKTARARIIWEGAIARAEAIFGDRPEVGIGRKHGLPVFDFTRALMRFKKMDASYATSGIATGQQRMFAAQNQVKQLTIWPQAPMVVAGYVLDDLEMGFDELVLVLHRDGKIVWRVNVPQERMVEAIPTSTAEPVPASVRSTRPIEEVDEEVK